MRAAVLTREQQQQVLTNVVIYDLSSQSVRLSCIKGDTVVPHYDNIDALSEVLVPFKPDWLIFDPLVSFGVGEQRVNDAEQGLIESFRILRNRFDACIEAIHHVGKVNGRERSTDQYSGRGGSALPDGSRMVAVLTPIDAGEWRKRTGTELEATQSGILLSLPKLSFCRPQSDVLILRDGYAMSQVARAVDDAPAGEREADIVFAYVVAQYNQGRRLGKTAVSDLYKDIGLTRNDVRVAIKWLEDKKRLVQAGKQGEKGTHLAPVTSASGGGGSGPK
jgi:RecA-family ATPase